jgi:diguanylate cyclase
MPQSSRWETLTLEVPMTSTQISKPSTEFAHFALMMMEQKDLDPTPQNYAVWYSYASKANPELKRVVDAHLDEKSLTAELCADIYAKFLAPVDKSAQVGALADKLETEMGTAISLIGRAGQDAARYGEALESAGGEIENPKSDQDLTEVVGRLISDTRTAVDQTRAVEGQLSQAAAEIQRLKNELETAQSEANMDALTGLANRKNFDSMLSRGTGEAKESDKPLSLLVLDVDHFKKFNDTYGHQVGDQVLKLLGAILRNNVKGQDTAARYGGEEFAVILPNTSLDNALKLAETIRNQVAGKSVVQRNSGEKLGQITVSIGVSQYVRGEPMEQVIQRADQALYCAKGTGRNRVVSERELRKAASSVG